ncbi:MAG: PilZ domain-containing protein [Desulforegulaceae bacterium]|nr:PilZ domain-containing protein [Desulforegulaceae bacterium]
MEAYIKKFKDQNKLFVRIKKIESEDQADFFLKTTIKSLRELENGLDIIFDVRDYKVSEANFEYEYVKKFLLVMCVKMPKSIIRIGGSSFILLADQIIQALNVRLDSKIITSDSYEGIKKKLNKEKGLEKFALWFSSTDFNPDLQEKNKRFLNASEHLMCDLNQSPVDILSVTVNGNFVPSNKITINVKAVSESAEDIYYRYYYKKSTLEKNPHAYIFPLESEWTTKNFCSFSIKEEGRYHFYVEAANSPEYFDRPDSSYALIPLFIRKKKEYIENFGNYFYKNQMAELIFLTKDMKKKVINAKIESADIDRKIVHLINLEPGFDLSLYKNKFVLSCVTESHDGIYRYAFKSVIEKDKNIIMPMSLNDKFTVLYEDDPKKVNLRRELRYKIGEKDSIVLYIYYEGGLFASGKIFELADISTGGFGIVLNSVANNSLSEMTLKSIVKTQFILTPDETSEPVIITPNSELRWKNIDNRKDTAKMGFKFIDNHETVMKEIQYYISLKML